MAKKKKVRRKPQRRGKSLWQGPESEGITHSLLGAFANNSELCAQAYVDGKRPREMSMELEYGNLHHLLDETYQTLLHGIDGGGKRGPRVALRQASKVLDTYCEKRGKRVGRKGKDDLGRWSEMVKALYPVFLNHYKDCPLTFFSRESVFKVPWMVPALQGFTSTVVQLTGKRDGLYRTRNKEGQLVSGLYEIKTKTRIDRDKLLRQLRCDSQSCFYLLATELEYQAGLIPNPPRQETYEVIKRPGIVQKKNQSFTAYLKEIQDHATDRRAEYFARIELDITREQIMRFGHQFLTPELRVFLSWWRSIAADPSPEGRKNSPLHCLTLRSLNPVYGDSPYYQELVVGGGNSLCQVNTAFPELLDWDQEHTAYGTSSIEATPEEMTALGKKAASGTPTKKKRKNRFRK